MERKMLNITLRHRLRNEDIRSQTHLKDAAETADKLKKKWTGHVMRLNANRWTYILTTWDPKIGRRNVGRQKTRHKNQPKTKIRHPRAGTANSYNKHDSHHVKQQLLREKLSALRAAISQSYPRDLHLPSNYIWMSNMGPNFQTILNDPNMHKKFAKERENIKRQPTKYDQHSLRNRTSQDNGVEVGRPRGKNRAVKMNPRGHHMEPTHRKKKPRETKIPMGKFVSGNRRQPAVKKNKR
ncbi:hypothetical protein ANN_08450 [Periplaneta americana]|uniref:Uncharacterized protein n=1 Tax=Periplaneta americana TaxID=6978 RepID=A0ABQ8T2U4_PERAM|nr:hypothetical protein ANN_08450 [Periplaneta americana]